MTTIFAVLPLTILATLSPPAPAPSVAIPSVSTASTASTVTTQNAAVQAAAPEAPLTERERVSWFLNSSVGPKSLGAGVVSAAWGVARDSPDEYGANLRGFGKRYVIRLSGVVIGNGIEAGLGAAWDEDPRYQRTASLPQMAAAQTGAQAGARRDRLWSRVGHAARMTVMARRPDGRLAPAYARFTGIVGNNFMTNAWRVDSDSSVNDALSRSAVGVLGRFVSNLFDEFWPR